jgi:N-acetyl-gamma-glutamyl-phosphate reductase
VDVGVVGGSGYGGAELLRLLAGHPSFKIRTIGAGRSAGRDLAEVFPHLGMSGPLAPAHPEAFEGCDVVFLATPDEVSLELAPALSGGVGLVVDLSAAFRLDAGVYERTYARPHTAAALTPAPYGLPELFRDGLPGRTLVAGPGCYPTAALLALAPLAGLVDPASVVIAGLSGTSGAGRGLRDDLHASHAVGNVSVYGAPSHRHTPEIEAGWAALAALDEVAPVTFTPHLVPLSRGLHCTVTAMLCDPAADVRAACLDRYDAEPFVTVLPPGVWPSTTHLRGGNAAHVGAAVDGRTGRVTVACAIDNLGKGAAGQAIQAANAVLGLPETSGLPIAGVYP